LLRPGRRAARSAVPGRPATRARSGPSPTRTALLAPVGERLGVAVDLLLVGAVDLERDRLVERELRAAVERDELLAVELELHDHHGAGVARPGLAVARDVDDPRVREDRRVELGGLLALGVEPQTRRDLRHGMLLSSLGSVLLIRPTGRRELIALETDASAPLPRTARTR